MHDNADADDGDVDVDGLAVMLQIMFLLSFEVLSMVMTTTTTTMMWWMSCG